MTTTTPTEELLNAALFWADLGVPVFPLTWPVEGKCSCGDAGCKSQGKHPLSAAVPHGLNDATTNHDTIRAWWSRWPKANLGICTGYLFDVVDIDGATGSETFRRLATRHGSPYHHGDVETGREDTGLHLYVTPGGQRNHTGGVGGMPPGIDIRGRGGYVVAPPSLHVTGNYYRWFTPFDMGRDPLGNRDWPEWLEEIKAAGSAPTATTPAAATPSPQRFVKPEPFTPSGANEDSSTAYGAAVLRRATGLVEHAGEGSRWQTLAMEAIPLIARAAAGECLDVDEAITALEKAATTAGLDPSEIRRIRPLTLGMIQRGISKPIAPTRQPLAEPVAPLQPFATEEEARYTQWETPEGLLRNVPSFPVEILGWLAEPVMELSRRFQTPPDLAGMMTLSLVSACTLGRGRVQAAPGWEEPMNLFLAVVLGSGETKSPLLSVLLRRLREVERQAQADAAPLIAAATDLHAIHENALKKAIAEASKGGSEQMAEVIDARKRLDENVIPKKPLYLAGDMTPEAMVKVLADQNGVIAHISAEGGLLDTLVGGRYSNGQAQITDLLNAHDGREPIKVHRKHAEDLIVPDPCMTLGLAVQPQVLEALGANPVAIRRGLHARFLFAVPPSRIGRRNMSLTFGEGDAEEAFAHLTDALLSIYGGPEESNIEDCESRALKYVLETSSSSMFTEYRKHLEPRRHRIMGDLGDLGAWANKLDGQLLRLAGILQTIKDVGPSSPNLLPHLKNIKSQKPPSRHPQKSSQILGTITPETMAETLVLGDYLISHALEAHEVMGEASDDLLDARRVLAWINATGRAEFTVRDAHQALKGRGRFREVAAVQDALGVLAARGWVWPVPPETRKEKGRPASPKYLTHPLALVEVK